MGTLVLRTVQQRDRQVGRGIHPLGRGRVRSTPPTTNCHGQSDAVRTGEPVEPPSTLNLLLARRVRASTLGTAPPFVALLVTQNAADLDVERSALFATGHWLRSVADVIEPIEFELPVIHTFDEDALPLTGTPVIDPYDWCEPRSLDRKTRHYADLFAGGCWG